MTTAPGFRVLNKFGCSADRLVPLIPSTMGIRLVGCQSENVAVVRAPEIDSFTAFEVATLQGQVNDPPKSAMKKSNH